MLEFQEKKRLRSIMYSKVTLIAFFIVFVFIAKATLGVYYKNKSSRINLERTKEEIAKLEKRERALTFEINRLETAKGTEEEMRKRFMVGKEGEEVIVIVDEEISKEGGGKGITGAKSLWSKFLDIFR